MAKKYSTLDKIEVDLKDNVYRGIVMPNSDSKTLFLKLESGYNLGILSKNIKKIKLIKKVSKNKTQSSHKIKHNNNLPLISILHTGGTIASKVDYNTGGVISRFEPEELIGMFPELEKIANIESIFISNIFSENLRFRDYKKLADAIEKEIKKGVKGIIIGHGTDTLHYTSAALSFMFDHLPIPIILVGSQRSSDRGSSDAALNLINAAYFIANTPFKGVGICMHKNIEDDSCLILPPLKTRKLHTSRRDAFKVVNSNPIAEVNYSKNKFIMFSKSENEQGTWKVKAKFEEKVGILKVYPNLNSKQIESFKGYKGLIIEGTGLGHISTDNSPENKKIFNTLKKLSKNCVIVMTSQCLFGRVNLNVYSTGRDLLKIGIIPGEDMLPETAYIKLAWLLGNYKKQEVRQMISKNLKGEINKRLDLEFL
ncbi:MAG: Glu-tRNA(Gln) amidotransferase subunit GatD [Candidatus Nanoarchaeia archaeon]|nr:Glu-tRNA(Gln) amidotransferase subunit GatD [Candidatus Nanoarchaeia archaeon]